MAALFAGQSSEQLKQLVTELAFSPEIHNRRSEEFATLRNALKELGQRDGAAAWEWVMEFESFRKRKMLSEIVLVGISERDQDLALQLYQDHYDTMGAKWGSEAAAFLLEESAKRGVEDLMTTYRDFPGKGGPGIFVPVRFPDGFDFGRLIKELRHVTAGGALPTFRLYGVLDSWARQDADAAISFALQEQIHSSAFGTSSPVADILNAQIGHLGEARAMEWLAEWYERDPALLESKALLQLASTFHSEPDLTEGIANALPPGDARQELIRYSAVNQFISHQPERAIRYMEFLPEGSERMGFLNTFIEQVSTLQTSPMSDSTFSNVAERFRQWGISEQEITAIRNKFGVTNPTPSAE